MSNYRIPPDGLSPKAKRLVELLGFKGSVSKALKDDPSLIEGLDEYVKWVGEEREQIACAKELPTAGHNIKRLFKRKEGKKKH